MDGTSISSERKKSANLPAERQQQILHLIKVNGSAQITELSALLGVSQATVRRDLDELEQRGAIERTHGGAVAVRGGTAFERHHEEKMGIMQDEKRRIGEAAASCIREGDTVFLDSGTTVFALGQFIKEIKNLTIITYDMVTGFYLDLHPSSSLIVTGGIRRMGHNNVLIGSRVEDFLRNLRVDKSFLGADALDLDFGVSNSNYSEANIKRLATEIAEKVYLMADHTKFGKSALAKVCSLSDIDVLITDGDGSSFLSGAEKQIDCIIKV